MISKHCGVKLVSLDTVEDSGLRNRGHVVWRDVRKTPGLASWRCSVCGRVFTQKLREKKA